MCSLLSFSTQQWALMEFWYNDCTASVLHLYFLLGKLGKRHEDAQNTTLNKCGSFQAFYVWLFKCSTLIPLLQMRLPLKLINLSNLAHKICEVILPIHSHF